MLKYITEYNLMLCADSIEWCPKVGYRDLLVCGSYQLLQDSNREGIIDLFHYKDALITHIQELKLNAGLLDAKWAPNTPNDTVLLAAALSDGNVNIYKLKSNKLIIVSSTEVCSNGMALAIDWSSGAMPDFQTKLVISQSNGNIAVLLLNEDGSLIKVNEFKGHDYEAWVAAFNYWNTNIVYSGGDDCKLKMYDLRNSDSRPIHTDASHNVGITSLQCNQKFEGFLASASYENVKIWKTTNSKMECLNEEEMKGGAWRIKWNIAGNCKAIAVAAMHEGFSIIDYTTNELNSNLNETDFQASKRRISYTGPHNSLGYGIDWSYEDSNIISACSFYDKKLSIAQLIK